jgi:vitamin B12 transporter
LLQNKLFMKEKLVGLIFLFTLNLQAQQTVVQQDDVSVTATNSTQKNVQTGRNIVVIQGELFNKLPINSVDELLRYVAGVEVQQRGVQGSQSDILIRGGTFQQVLVLIDGIRLNDPLTGHFNGNIPIHPADIERVEILKGPASAVWGADAVGGVIHFITKAFNKKKYDAKKMQIGFQLGELGLLQANLYAQKQTKNAFYSVGILSNNAVGHQLRGTTGSFNNNTIHVSTQQLLKDNWRLSFKSVLDYRSFNAQNFYTTFKSDTAKEDVNTFFNHIQLQKSWNNQSFSTDLAFKTLSDEFQFNNVGAPNLNKTRQLIYQLNYSNKLDDNTNFVTGVQLMNRTISSNDRGNHQIFNFGTWFIMKHQFKNNLFINEGVRVDYNQNYGTVLVPQINIAYNPNKFNFRASYAQGIRDADFTERFNNYNKALVTSGSIGNPDLKTEKTWNAEVGVDCIAKNNVKISSTLFYRNQNNLIDFAVTSYANMPRKVNLIPTGTYALATNLSNVKTYGAELDVQYKKVINTKHSILFNYNLSRFKSESDAAVVSFYIIGHANWLSNFNAIYSINNFSIAINGLFKARTARNAAPINATVSKDYFTLNSKLNYSFYNKKVNVYLQGVNIFDKKYSDILGAVMPGRWISGGLQMQIP